MKPQQVNYLLITTTLCISFFTWGTIFVYRMVEDRNYHPLTAEQQKVKDLEDCTFHTPKEVHQQCKPIIESGSK